MADLLGIVNTLNIIHIYTYIVKIIHTYNDFLILIAIPQMYWCKCINNGHGFSANVKIGVV